MLFLINSSYSVFVVVCSISFYTRLHSLRNQNNYLKSCFSSFLQSRQTLLGLLVENSRGLKKCRDLSWLRPVSNRRICNWFLAFSYSLWHGIPLLFTLISFHNCLLGTLCLDMSKEKMYSFKEKGFLAKIGTESHWPFLRSKKKHCLKLAFKYCVDNRSLVALRSRGVHPPVPYFKVLMSAPLTSSSTWALPYLKNSVPLPQGLESLPSLLTSRSGSETLS